MAPEVDQGNGLLFAYVLDGQGGGRELDWEGIRAWSPEDGVLWVHLDRKGWLEELRLCYDKRFMPKPCDTARFGARDGERAKIWRGL